MDLRKSILAASIALATAAVPVGSFAQSEAAAAPAAPPSYGRADESVKGRVTSFDGAYSLQVRDDRGFIDNVQLHPGTIIIPTGVRLAPGMAVTIYGVNHGPVFAANEIDTPYQTYGDYPAYPPFAYGYPYPYPYPVYAYPFSFGIRVGPGFHHR
jgi:hypothetical protein